jgi:hypothetical protein
VSVLLSEGHLTEFELAKLLLDDAKPTAHIDGCGHCRGEFERIRAEGATFTRKAFPRTLSAVEARLSRRRLSWLATAAFSVVAVAIAMLWLVGDDLVAPRALRASQPGVRRPVIAAKGGPVLHLVARRTAGGEERIFGIESGAHLASGDAIRFVVDRPDGLYLLVVSVDGAGQVNVYYPYGGADAGRIEPGARVVLDGSIVLDDAVGPERVWAVVSDRQVTVAELRAQLPAIARGGAAAIRQGAELNVLGAYQTSVWFEKSSQPVPGGGSP